MINKVAVIAAFIGVILLSILVWAALHYHGKSVAQAVTITTLNQQKNEDEFITSSQALSVGIFNQISGATLDAQKSNASASESRQVIIKTVLKTNACAIQPVPVAASGSLLEHYNAIRKSAGNTNTGQPAGGLPAVQATK